MRIFRISNLLFLGLATMFGVLLFWTSQAVQQKEEELAQARQSLDHEKETVRVLSVEWDYLNRPQRLEKLAAEQLGMELPAATEVVRNVGDIPEPVIVNTNPAFLEEDLVQTVSLEPAAPAMLKPQVPHAPKKETVVPATVEKQSFDKLIQSLDGEGDAQ